MDEITCVAAVCWWHMHTSTSLPRYWYSRYYPILFLAAAAAAPLSLLLLLLLLEPLIFLLLLLLLLLLLQYVMTYEGRHNHAAPGSSYSRGSSRGRASSSHKSGVFERMRWGDLVAGVCRHIF
jgi:hypothetical protein